MILENGEETFFSSHQSSNRDATIAFVSEYFYGHDGVISILDAFTGIGSRAIKYAHYFKKLANIIGVDKDKDCIEIASRNVLKNSLDPSRITFIQSDVISFFKRHLDCNVKYDVIELDPFGSSRPYIRHAVNALNNNGLLCLNFTDSRTLFGDTTDFFSVYGTTKPHSVAYHEFSLRAVICTLLRDIHLYGKAGTPIACWNYSHGCRCIIRVTKIDTTHSHSDSASSILINSLNEDDIGFIVEHPQGYFASPERYYYSTSYSSSNINDSTKFNGDKPDSTECSSFSSSSSSSSSCVVSGPVWLGELCDVKILEKTLVSLNDPSKMFDSLIQTRIVIEMINQWLTEASTFSTTTTSVSASISAHICDHTDVSENSENSNSLCEILRRLGYRACSLHADDRHLKTNGPLSAVMQAIRDGSGRTLADARATAATAAAANITQSAIAVRGTGLEPVQTVRDTAVPLSVLDTTSHKPHRAFNPYTPLPRPDTVGVRKCRLSGSNPSTTSQRDRGRVSGNGNGNGKGNAAKRMRTNDNEDENVMSTSTTSCSMDSMRPIEVVWRNVHLESPTFIDSLKCLWLELQQQKHYTIATSDLVDNAAPSQTGMEHVYTSCRRRSTGDGDSSDANGMSTEYTWNRSRCEETKDETAVVCIDIVWGGEGVDSSFKDLFCALHHGSGLVTEMGVVLVTEGEGDDKGNVNGDSHGDGDGNTHSQCVICKLNRYCNIDTNRCFIRCYKTLDELVTATSGLLSSSRKTSTQSKTSTSTPAYGPAYESSSNTTVLDPIPCSENTSGCYSNGGTTTSSSGSVGLRVILLLGSSSGNSIGCGRHCLSRRWSLHSHSLGPGPGSGPGSISERVLIVGIDIDIDIDIGQSTTSDSCNRDKNLNGTSTGTWTGIRSRTAEIHFESAGEIVVNNVSVAFVDLSLKWCNTSSLKANNTMDKGPKSSRSLITASGANTHVTLYRCISVSDVYSELYKSCVSVTLRSHLNCIDCDFHRLFSSIYSTGKSVVTLDTCTITDCNSDGVFASGGCILTMMNCNVSKAKKSGIKLTQDVCAVLEDCNLHHNKRCGLEAFTCSVKINNSSIDRNFAGGLLFQSCEVFLKTCSVSLNRLANIHISRNTQLNAFECVIREGHASGVYISGPASRAELCRCRIYGNRIRDIEEVDNCIVVIDMCDTSIDF
eukprot:gene7770-15901_t